MSDEQNKPTSGNFLSGLFFGAVAGAAGYFFMKTEEGKKARKKLSEEWEKAKQDLSKSGVIEDATKSLPETIQHTIQHIIEPSKVKKEAAPKKSGIKSMEPPAKKEKEVKPKKFKGAA